MGRADAADPGAIHHSGRADAVQENARLEIYPQYVPDPQYHFDGRDRIDLSEPLQSCARHCDRALQPDLARLRYQRAVELQIRLLGRDIYLHSVWRFQLSAAFAVKTSGSYILE